MKPVNQTRYGHPHGNCMMAAIASVLELPLEEIPDQDGSLPFKEWWTKFMPWLKKRGLTTLGVSMGDWSKDFVEHMDGVYCVATGPVAGLQHSAVWHNGKIAHDPHARGLGDEWPGMQPEDVEELIVFVPLNPAAHLGALVEEPYLEWDTCKLTEQQVQFVREGAAENGEDMSEEEATRLVGEDSDFLSNEWEHLCDALTELMDEMGSIHWRAEVTNFGWEKKDGHLEFKAKTGEEFLRAVLPPTDCTFELFKRDGEIAINNAHHDSPTFAEWYYIRPIKEVP